MSSRSSPGPHRVGTQITADVVCLIDADGTRVGDVPLAAALRHADTQGLDLVEVAAHTDPPVCRVVDYTKMRYEQSRNGKNRNKPVPVKEMKYGVRIGSADFDMKTAKVRKFLVDGHRVKVTVHLRGRERSRPQLGRDLLTRVVDTVSDVSKVDGTMNGSSGSVTAMLVPTRR